MKQNFLLLTIMTCLTSLSVTAQTPAPPQVQPLKPEFFDARLPITTQGNNAFYSITLTAAVYERTHSPFLNDVRVFNHDGKIVPHILRELPDAKFSSEVNRATLKFYPVYANKTDQQDPAAVILDTSGKPAITIGAAKPDSKARITSYVLEVPKLLTDTGGETELTFDWLATDPSFIRNVAIDASADMQSWSTITQNRALTRFQYHAQLLEKTTLDAFVTKDTRYLRLRWQPDDSDFPLTKVSARFEKSHKTRTERLERSATGVLMKDGVLYDLKGNFPVRSVMITLPQTNSFLDARLNTCPNNQPCAGRNIANALIYRLNLQGSELTNDAVEVYDTSFRYWQLQSRDGTYPFDDPAPQLKIQWVPHQLIFLAQGPGPFELAVGRNDELPALNQTVTLTQLIDSSKAPIPEAAIAAPQDKPAIADQIKQPAIPYKTYILWASMILCTGVLAFIAWRLLADNNRNKPSSGS